MLLHFGLFSDPWDGDKENCTIMVTSSSFQMERTLFQTPRLLGSTDRCLSFPVSIPGPWLGLAAQVLSDLSFKLQTGALQLSAAPSSLVAWLVARLGGSCSGLLW